MGINLTRGPTQPKSKHTNYSQLKGLRWLDALPPGCPAGFTYLQTKGLSSLPLEPVRHHWAVLANFQLLPTQGWLAQRSMPICSLHETCHEGQISFYTHHNPVQFTKGQLSWEPKIPTWPLGWQPANLELHKRREGGDAVFSPNGQSGHEPP